MIFKSTGYGTTRFATREVLLYVDDDVEMENKAGEVDESMET